MGIPASPRRDHPRPPAPHRPTPRLGHPHSGLVSGPGPTSGTPHAEHTAAIRSELVGEAATDDVEGGANGGEEATVAARAARCKQRLGVVLGEDATVPKGHRLLPRCRQRLATMKLWRPPWPEPKDASMPPHHYRLQSHTRTSTSMRVSVPPRGHGGPARRGQRRVRRCAATRVGPSAELRGSCRSVGAYSLSWLRLFRLGSCAASGK
jgi:hypothetical protein